MVVSSEKATPVSSPMCAGLIRVKAQWTKWLPRVRMNKGTGLGTEHGAIRVRMSTNFVCCTRLMLCCTLKSP